MSMTSLMIKIARQAEVQVKGEEALKVQIKAFKEGKGNLDILVQFLRSPFRGRIIMVKF